MAAAELQRTLLLDVPVPSSPSTALAEKSKQLLASLSVDGAAPPATAKLVVFVRTVSGQSLAIGCTGGHQNM